MKKSIGSLLMVAAVATGVWFWMGSSKEQLKDDLKDRVSQYWAAKQVNDIRTLYELEAGSVDGTLTAAAAYGALMSNVYVDQFEITEVQVDSVTGVAKLALKLTFDALEGKEFDSKMEDHWVLIDGIWYHDTGYKPPRPALTQGAQAPSP